MGVGAYRMVPCRRNGIFILYKNEKTGNDTAEERKIKRAMSDKPRDVVWRFKKPNDFYGRNDRNPPEKNRHKKIPATEMEPRTGIFRNVLCCF